MPRPLLADRAPAPPQAQAVLPPVPDPNRLLGARSEGWKRLPGGSVPLFTDGHAVAKLFPSSERRYADTEWTALAFLHGRLPLPTPEPIELLVRDDWIVVRMTHLPGLPARGGWSRWSPEQHAGLARQVGACLRALHDLEPPDDPVLRAPHGSFENFLAAQRERFSERMLLLGAEPACAERCKAFLEQHFADRDPAPREALLHTEISPEHVLVREGPAGPEACGLVDFEPAMIGDPRYELGGQGWWWGGGDQNRHSAVLEGYGELTDERGVPTPDELLLHCLLHRYFHPEKWLAQLPLDACREDLESLARRLYP